METEQEPNDNILEQLKYSNHTYKEIFRLENEKKLKNYYNVDSLKNKGCFMVQNFNTDVFDFFFEEPITICYKSQNNSQKDINIMNIYSTAQIEDNNTRLFYNNPFVIHDNNNIDYYKAKYEIYNYINNKKLIIYNEISSFNTFKFDHNILDQEIFKKNEFSKYFNDYFAYNNTKDEMFKYDDTNNRIIFNNNFFRYFLINKNLRFFKFCGPSSTGKSTTLLKLSKEKVGIIYLNLKKIHKLGKIGNYIDSYNLIIYEFRRLFPFYDEQLKLFNEMLQKNIYNSIWFIIINILEFIKDTHNIIIFDQFKRSYINIDDFNKIENIIQNSKLKLILCSSINNYDIRDEIIKTIKEYKGNPKELDEKSQYYYFYFYHNFFDKTINDNNNKLNALYQLFDFKPKYIHLLSESKNNYKKCIDETKSQIQKKIKEFFMFENSLDICKILLNIKNIINSKLSYDRDIEKLIKIPLKYYKLNLQEDYFTIEYAFDFIQYIEKENITKEECDNYFKLDKYKIDKSFDGKVKGEFFEMSARFFIQNNNVLPNKIDNIINVKNIVGMEPLLEVESIDNILNDINLGIESKNFDLKQIEENDINKALNILKEKNITTKQDLDNNFKDTKNLEYYYINALLNFYSKKSQKNNKNKNTDNEKGTQNKEDEDDDDRKDDDNNKSKKKIPKIENKSVENIDKILGKKTKRKASNKINNVKKIKNINNKNILLEQEQINGKTLDQGFIYNITNENEKKYIFIGLQMKCLSDNANHSTSLKKITKKKIKENIQNILIRSKLDYDINIDEWHYYIVAYYNKLDKDNIFCNQLNEHCKSQDISIIYYDPKNPSLYINRNNKFDKISKISLSNLSNLEFDFTESNPYHIIYNNYNEELINSYYTQRKEKINEINNYYNKSTSLEDKYLSWLKICNRNKSDVENLIINLFNVKSIKILDCYNLISDMPIPCPSENHLFLFVNNEKSNFVCFLRDKKFEAKNLETGHDIKIIDLSKFIYTAQQEFFIFYFNK